MKTRDQRRKRKSQLSRPRVHTGVGNYGAEQALTAGLRKDFEDAGYRRIYRLEEMGVQR